MEAILNSRMLVENLLEHKITPADAVAWIEKYANDKANEEKPLTDAQIKALRATCKNTLIERMEKEWYLKEGGSKLIDMHVKEALEELNLPKNIKKVKQKYFDALDSWFYSRPAEGW